MKNPSFSPFVFLLCVTLLLGSQTGCLTSWYPFRPKSTYPEVSELKVDEASQEEAKSDEKKTVTVSQEEPSEKAVSKSSAASSSPEEQRAIRSLEKTLQDERVVKMWASEVAKAMKSKPGSDLQDANEPPVPSSFEPKAKIQQVAVGEANIRSNSNNPVGDEGVRQAVYFPGKNNVPTGRNSFYQETEVVPVRPAQPNSYNQTSPQVNSPLVPYQSSQIPNTAARNLAQAFTPNHSRFPNNGLQETSPVLLRQYPNTKLSQTRQIATAAPSVIQDSQIQQVAFTQETPVKAPSVNVMTNQILTALKENHSLAPDREERIRAAVQESLVLMAAGRRSEALKPIADLGPQDQAAWNDLIFALGTYLEQTTGKQDKAMLAESITHFESALNMIRNKSALALNNIAFCKSISSFGSYESFDKYTFKPGQELLLYVEIANFKSMAEAENGFVTKLESRYVIFDDAGNEVANHDFPQSIDQCKTRRHDYFHTYRFHLPKTLSSGVYTLQLTVEDMLANKSGQTTIELQISK